MNCLEPLFLNEPNCETIYMKMSFIENESVGGTHFHLNGVALRLVLMQRPRNGNPEK